MIAFIYKVVVLVVCHKQRSWRLHTCSKDVTRLLQAPQGGNLAFAFSSLPASDFLLVWALELLLPASPVQMPIANEIKANRPAVSIMFNLMVEPFSV